MHQLIQPVVSLASSSHDLYSSITAFQTDHGRNLSWRIYMNQRSVSYILIYVMRCLMKVKAWFHQPCQAPNLSLCMYYIYESA